MPKEIYRIKGLHVLSSHWRTERGELELYKDKNNDWRAVGYEHCDCEVIAQAAFERLADTPEDYILIDSDFARFIAEPGECERIGLDVDRRGTEPEQQIYLSMFHQNTYQESALPCQISDGKLTLALSFDRFQWMEADSGDTEGEPYDGDGEPHVVRAHSTAHGYILDITILSPAAKQLCAMGLVDGAPDNMKIK